LVSKNEPEGTKGGRADSNTDVHNTIGRFRDQQMKGSIAIKNIKVVKGLREDMMGPNVTRVQVIDSKLGTLRNV